MAAGIFKLLAIFKPTNLLATGLVVAMGYGAMLAYDYYQAKSEARRKHQELIARSQELVAKVQSLKDENAALKENVGELEAQCAELDGFIERLTAESRVAEVNVTARKMRPDGVPVHTLEFHELDRDGNPLKPRVFDVPGKEIYFEALIIKFADDEVKLGDPLRGKSLHLFRRVFGAAQEPRDGVLVCTSQKDGIPDLYRVSAEPSQFEQRLWRLFWHWASHPKEAAEYGVRVPQIEAPAIRPVVGGTYRITLENDGGLNIKLVEPDE